MVPIVNHMHHAPLITSGWSHDLGIKLHMHPLKKKTKISEFQERQLRLAAQELQNMETGKLRVTLAEVSLGNWFFPRNLDAHLGSRNKRSLQVVVKLQLLKHGFTEVNSQGEGWGWWFWPVFFFNFRMVCWHMSTSLRLLSPKPTGVEFFFETQKCRNVHGKTQLHMAEFHVEVWWLQDSHEALIYPGSR